MTKGKPVTAFRSITKLGVGCLLAGSTNVLMSLLHKLILRPSA